jgi:hypothetical protein
MSDYLVIGGWSGRRKIPVQVLAETPEGFWIKPTRRAFVPGRGLLKKGQRVLVPRSLIKLDIRDKQAAPRKNLLSNYASSALRKVLRLLGRVV